MPNQSQHEFQRQAFEATLKKHMTILEKAIARKLSTEGILQDERMQELSFRFMRYVAVWLLRIASQSDYKPDTAGSARLR
jgi:ubiquitin conjugation factor E4 B